MLTKWLAKPESAPPQKEAVFAWFVARFVRAGKGVLVSEKVAGRGG